MSKGKWKRAWLASGQMAVFGMPELKQEIRFGLVPGELVYGIGDPNKVGANVQVFPNGLRYEGVLTIKHTVTDVDCMLFQLKPNLYLCFMIMGELVLPLKSGIILKHAPIFTRNPPQKVS